jgi:hypothetical protein
MMKNKVVSDESLQKVMNGDNSETNKKQKFDDVLNKTIMSFFNERFDFFKKIDDPKVKSFISNFLYEEMKSGNLEKFM